MLRDGAGKVCPPSFNNNRKAEKRNIEYLAFKILK